MADVSVEIVSSNRESPKHVLSLGRKVAYSFGHVLNDLCASMWFTYLLIFQHAVLKFNNITTGNLLLLGQVADAVSTPFVGFESDKPNNLWLCKYGRRKAWHLVGTICVIATFPFLFMQCVSCENSSENAQFLYFGAFIVIFQFGWASVQVSHLSLIPDLTPVSSERVELNSLRNAMTGMSNICAYSTMWAILGLTSGAEKRIGPQDLHVFKHVALSMVGIGALFSLTFHVFVKERDHELFSERQEFIINQASESYEKPHLTWKDWFSQPQFYMIALLYMATRLYVNLSQVYIPPYIQDSLELHKDKVAIIPLVIYVSGFISSFFMKFLNGLLGKKVTYFLGSSLAMSSCIWIFYGAGEQFCTYEIYGVAALIGVAGSTLLIISLSITSDLIANSTTSSAFVFGCMSFVDKLSNGVALVIIQDVHPCISCCDDCKWYYKYVLVFACGGAVILGLVALGFLLTQSIGVRRNEEQLHRNSIIRNNRRWSESVSKVKESKPLLHNDDSDGLET
ncbi:major facilitator superfamily domain-containing protein 12-like [Uloborus diversus]|uniref:major facilitator superfamily domain-containing protein 12-like n=1 Tax=Uloborus diversus TaxID=327109 RepID=UPI002409F4E8|nr:major facilitator superfamily domain-containing protein 12-like [Uloborus diversus]